MELTDEQLDAKIDARIERRLEINRSVRGNPDVRNFKEEVKQWCITSGEGKGHTAWNTLQSAVFRAITAKLDIKSIGGLNADQLPTARKVFEDFKRLVA